MGIVGGVDVGESFDLKSLGKDELAAVKELAAHRGKPGFAEDVRWESGHPPVCMAEFVESKEYLGLGGKIYPRILKLLSLINRPDVREANLLLGKSSGKTVLASLVLARGAYVWECYRDPQTHFGMLKEDKAAVINLSTGREQARDKVWDLFQKIISRSRWFRGRFRELTTSMEFSKGLSARCGHSSSKAWEGYNVFAGVLDEANKMFDSRGRSTAEALRNTLVSQAESRFPDNYKVVVISSRESERDFVSREVHDVIERGVRIDLDGNPIKMQYPDEVKFSIGATIPKADLDEADAQNISILSAGVAEKQGGKA